MCASGPGQLSIIHRLPSASPFQQRAFMRSATGRLKHRDGHSRRSPACHPGKRPQREIRRIPPVSNLRPRYSTIGHSHLGHRPGPYHLPGSGLMELTDRTQNISGCCDGAVPCTFALSHQCSNRCGRGVYRMFTGACRPPGPCASGLG